MADRLLFTLAEVAEQTGFSERSLADDCRAARIEHVHRGRDRLMTRDQIDALIRSHIVGPRDDTAALDAVRRRRARRAA